MFIITWALNLNSTPSFSGKQQYPAIVNFFETRGIIENKPVKIPVLYASSLLLTNMGASSILIPTPQTEDHCDKIKSSIKDLPRSLRFRIRTIDENGQILKKVKIFHEPLIEQAALNNEKNKDTMSNEQLFISASIDTLYQFMLACKYRAVSAATPISEVQYYIQYMNKNIFSDEALYRLSMLTYLFTRYDPIIVEKIGTISDVAEPGIDKVLLDMIETSEFADVVAASGYFGYIRHPLIGIKRLRKAIKNLLLNESYSSIVKSAEVIQDVTKLPIAIKPLRPCTGLTVQKFHY
jgi:hypothetical protein